VSYEECAEILRFRDEIARFPHTPCLRLASIAASLVAAAASALLGGRYVHEEVHQEAAVVA